MHAIKFLSLFFFSSISFFRFCTALFTLVVFWSTCSNRWCIRNRISSSLMPLVSQPCSMLMVGMPLRTHGTPLKSDADCSLLLCLLGREPSGQNKVFLLDCCLLFHFFSFNKVCTFPVCRLWLRNTALKNLRYHILNFDPRVLEGKVQVDPQKADSIKPVRGMLITFCSY